MTVLLPYQKQLKDINLVLQLAVFVIVIGNIVDIFSLPDSLKIIKYADAVAALVCLPVFIAFKTKHISPQIGLGIILGFSLFNAFLSLIMYFLSKDSIQYESLLYRDSTIVLLIISLTALFLKWYLAYIVLVLYYIFYIVLMYLSDSFRMQQDWFLVWLLFLSYTIIIVWFKRILSKVLDELNNSNTLSQKQILEIQEKSSILEEQAAEIGRKNSELILKNSQLESQSTILTELNNTKNKLFSIIAHDLKNPFSSILTLSEMLLEQEIIKDQEAVKRYGLLINESTKQSYDLLTNLLDWSRSQSGLVKYHPDYFLFNHIVENVFAFLYPLAGQKKITLENNVKVYIKVFADINMINAILRNLLSNALKFTPEGGKISVSITFNENEFAFLVEDSGIGIKPESLVQLFDIGKTISQNGTNSEKGTGIGLVLCKDFVDQHGGKIEVESVVNKGTIFKVIIPQKPEIIS